MAKKVKVQIKLQVPAGAANPAPPIGPALGQHGVNIMNFCKQFNEKTKKLEPGMTTPVLIDVYDDRSFTFVIKTPPASALIKKAIGLAKASSACNKEKVGKISKGQLRDIAKLKAADMNAFDIEASVKMLQGTANSMGIDIVE